MDYKKELDNDENIVKHQGAKVFGISLMVWIFSGLLLLAIAGFASQTLF